MEEIFKAILTIIGILILIPLVIMLVTAVLGVIIGLVGIGEVNDYAAFTIICIAFIVIMLLKSS